MDEIAILYKGAMVRAILAGIKTKTRRVVKPVGRDDSFVLLDHGNGWWPYRSDDGESSITADGNETPHDCPYGQPGDRLWAKETFYAWGRWETRFNEKKRRDEWHFIDMTIETGLCYRYAADVSVLTMTRDSIIPGWHKRPAIFMPRAASRITLEVTGVRVERLQDISEADAIAEGVSSVQCNDLGTEVPYYRSLLDARALYRLLWESINGPGSWDDNPWVWVVEFRRLP